MKLIQLTDLHLVPSGERLYGIKPQQRLAAALANIELRHPDADLLVITGDLSNEGDRDSYELLRSMLETCSIPYELLLGNHDCREEFCQVFPETKRDEFGFVQSSLETEVGVLLFLDTLEEGMVAGRYCTNRLQWLEHQLALYQQHPVYLFLHHPPFEIGLPAMDQCNLLEREAVFALLREHPRIEHIFCGHLHRPVHGVWHGIPYSCQPSTVHQFTFMTPTQPFELVAEPPVYSVINLQEQGVTVHLHQFLEEAPRGALGVD